MHGLDISILIEVCLEQLEMSKNIGQDFKLCNRRGILLGLNYQLASIIECGIYCGYLSLTLREMTMDLGLRRRLVRDILVTVLL